MLITAPPLGKLFGHKRAWAHRQIVAGRFGAVRRRGRAYLVELREVEREAGRKFSPVQLEAAGVHHLYESEIA